MTRFTPMAAALGVCTFLSLAAAAAPAQDRPIRVATANVPKIFNELQETKDLGGRFDQERARLAAEEGQKVNQLKDLEAEGKNYREGSPQSDEWRQRFTKARIDFKAWGEVAKADIDWKRKKQTRDLYEKIYGAVSEYATSNQIDLVLADHQPTMTNKEMEQVPAEQLPSILNQRRIIYTSKNADISDAIIASLDAKYKAGGGGQGPVGATGSSGPQAADANPAASNLRGDGGPGAGAGPRRSNSR